MEWNELPKYIGMQVSQLIYICMNHQTIYTLDITSAVQGSLPYAYGFPLNGCLIKISVKTNKANALTKFWQSYETKDIDQTKQLKSIWQSITDMDICNQAFIEYITETPPYKVTPDFYIRYSKNGGNLGSESK